MSSSSSKSNSLDRSPQPPAREGSTRQRQHHSASNSPDASSERVRSASGSRSITPEQQRNSPTTVEERISPASSLSSRRSSLSANESRPGTADQSAKSAQQVSRASSKADPSEELDVMAEGGSKLSPVARPSSNQSNLSCAASGSNRSQTTELKSLNQSHPANFLAPVNGLDPIKSHLMSSGFNSLDHFSAAMAAAAASQFASATNRHQQQQHQQQMDLAGAYHGMSPAALFALRTHLSQQQLAASSGSAHSQHLLSAFHSLAAGSAGPQLATPSAAAAAAAAASLFSSGAFPNGFGMASDAAKSSPQEQQVRKSELALGSRQREYTQTHTE